MLRPQLTFLTFILFEKYMIQIVKSMHANVQLNVHLEKGTFLTAHFIRFLKSLKNEISEIHSTFLNINIILHFFNNFQIYITHVWHKFLDGSDIKFNIIFLLIRIV